MNSIIDIVDPLELPRFIIDLKEQMASSSNNSNKGKNSVRGPYNKTGEPRFTSKFKTSIEDCRNMLQDLEDFRTLIHKKYNSSEYKSRILDGNQRSIDLLKHRIKREPKITEEPQIIRITPDPQQLILEAINRIEARLTNLEEQVGPQIDFSILDTSDLGSDLGNL